MRATIIALLTLFVTPAFAGKVKIKNCTHERVFACVYDAKETLKWAAADMGGVKHGDTKKFKCGTKNCKVFLGIAGFKKTNYTDIAAFGGVGAGMGGFAVGMMSAGGAGVGATFAMMGGGALGAAAVAVAVTKAVEAGKDAEKCEKIRKAAKDRIQVPGPDSGARQI